MIAGLREPFAPLGRRWPGKAGPDEGSPAEPVRSARILDALYATRDRLLASPSFQRWATRFPLTRGVARRRARALFDLCAGFVYSQVLSACVTLDLFEHLAAGPLGADVLAQRLALPLDGTRRLLDAACSLDLVARRGRDRYGLGTLGAALRGNPAVAAMVDHHALLYADLGDPVALLRGASTATSLAAYWPYATADRPANLTSAEVSPYTALMAASQAMITAEVLDAYPFAHHRVLLDVGGGNGAFLAAVADRHPDLRLMLFDLPAVADQARARFDRLGLARRTSVTGGDFHRNALPGGADLITLVRIVHDHDDDAALGILKAVRAAMPPDGTLLLAEPMSGTAGAEPIGDAYFGFYLLAMRSGRPRTPEALRTLLAKAGFERIEARRTASPMLTGLLLAKPSAAQASA